MDLLTNLIGRAADTVSPAEAHKRLAEKHKPFLLDVRQPEEFQAGHIHGAKLIPLGELRARINELPSDREIICVCRSGNRSLTATRQLRAAGLAAFNLHGGMLAWSHNGLPVRQGK